MPECRSHECQCGHLKEMHMIAGCAYRTCTCVSFNQCSAADMFVKKGRKGFNFIISGRGMVKENIDLQLVKTYIQGILAHADQNNMANFDYPFSLKKDKNKGQNFIFDMITDIGEYKD